MRVRVGWPLGTLAAFAVGYVAAVAGVPTGAARLSGDAGVPLLAAVSAVPPPPAGSSDALVDVSPGVDALGPPPPLRGSRADDDPTDGPDWGFTSPLQLSDLDTTYRSRRYSHGLEWRQGTGSQVHR